MPSSSAPRTPRPRPTAQSVAQDEQSASNQWLTPWSLFVVLIVFWLITQMGSLLVSALMAILLGTILETPVRRFQARGIPRAAAIAICYVGVIGAIVALIFLIVPVVDDQAAIFRDEFPPKLESLQQDWSGSNNPLLSGPGADLLQRGVDLFEGRTDNVEVSGDAAANALPVIGTVVGGLTSTITTLVITFYYLLEKGLIRRVVLEQLSGNVRGTVDSLWTEVESKVGGWIRGQLLLCLIIGTIATVSYGIIDLSFWPLLGLWAGITEIIPIVGPWIGGIPAVLVALTMGVDKALMVGAIIIVMQSLENWVLVPRVMRGAVGLTPLTVFVAILAGTELMGVVGAVLAIPISAALQVILTRWFNQRRAHMDDGGQHVSGWRWMLNRGRDAGPAVTDSEDPEFGEQVVSDEIYDGDPTNAAAPGVDGEAPLVDDDREAMAASTWPVNPWKGKAPNERRQTAWTATARGNARQNAPRNGGPTSTGADRRDRNDADS